MEDDAKATLEQAGQKTRAAADEVARTTATAARALFTALVLGLLAALVGAWVGTRHKRILHPVIEHVHETLAPSHATHTFHQRVQPSSVSVYDDAGHLISVSARCLFSSNQARSAASRAIERREEQFASFDRGHGRRQL